MVCIKMIRRAQGINDALGAGVYGEGARVEDPHPYSPLKYREREQRGIGKERQMAKEFSVGDHVSWNSEAGRVRGRIKKKVTSEIKFKGVYGAGVEG